MMKMKRYVSAAVILLVFFATLGIGAVMAQEDANETTEEVIEPTEDTNESQEEIEDEEETDEESEEEIEEDEEEVDEEITEAEEEITEAEEEISEESSEGVDTTQSEKYNSEAKVLLGKAVAAKNAGKYKEARKLARAAKIASIHAKRGRPFKKMKLLHLYDVFFHQLERHRIGMEAVIAYVNENGDTNAGSEQLVIIKDSFVSLEGELESAANSTDDRAFKKILKDARALTKDFREESHNVLVGEGEIGAARTQVNDALKENKEYLKSLLANIQNSREDAELEVIDEANDEIEEKIKNYKKEGGNTKELKEKLRELKDKREELEAELEKAIQSCGEVSVDECDTPEAQDYKAKKEEIKESYKELRKISRKVVRVQKVFKALRDSHRVLEKLEERITKAGEEGADVAALKAKLEEIKAMLDSTEAKYNESGYEGALDEFRNAKEAFKTTRKEYAERGKERRKEAVEKAKERREETIIKAKERREETIANAKERREEAVDKAKERREAFEDSKTLKDEE